MTNLMRLNYSSVLKLVHGFKLFYFTVFCVSEVSNKELKGNKPATILQEKLTKCSIF